jgi:hypothetical protein
MGAHHPLRVFSGSANRPLVEAVGQILGAPLGACITTRLSDSEIHVTIEDVVRDQDVFIIQPCSAPVTTANGVAPLHDAFVGPQLTRYRRDPYYLWTRNAWPRAGKPSAPRLLPRCSRR